MILRASLDGLSFMVVIGSLVDVLPPIAAGASFIYACIRIWESKTVQGWLGRDKRSQADTVDPRQPRDHVTRSTHGSKRSYPHDTD